MIKNYIKIFFRQLLKNKVFSFINIFGLAIGITFSTIIFLWIQDQYKVDNEYPEADRIYYIYTNQTFGDGKRVTWSSTPGLLALTMEEKYPEIEYATVANWMGTSFFFIEDQTFTAERIYTTSSFFDVFGVSFIEGKQKDVLHDENVVVLTEKGARKLFNSLDVVGKELALESKDRFKVVAVVKDFPPSSRFKNLEVLLPFSYFRKKNKWLENWGNSSFQSYARLHENADPDNANAKLKTLISEYKNEVEGYAFLYPLKDCHLKGKFENGEQAGGLIHVVKIFFVIGIFIILIACINFMNLTTAKSVVRSKEIGVRKVMGAVKPNLIVQFYGEVFLFTFFATALALMGIELILPFINQMIGRQLEFTFADRNFLMIISCIVGFTTLVAGSYPSFYMSSFNTIKVLRGALKSGKAALRFRQGLVIFQFCLSIILIIATIFLFQQVEYLKNKDLGFDKYDVINYYPARSVYKNFEEFRAEMLTHPVVKGVSRSSSAPFDVNNSTSDPQWEGSENNESNFHVISTDAQYLPVMDIKLLTGRNFDEKLVTDSVNYIINKKAAEIMGFTDPVGKKLKMWKDTPGEIIGLVDDFHNKSLHQHIEPLIITYETENVWMLHIKADKGKAKEALAALKSVHDKFIPGYPFDYRYMDEQYDSMYTTDSAMGQLSAIFGAVAIIISCLGLFGLSAFSIEQRTREIGIRKALGSSTFNLVWKLNYSFTWLIIISLAIAAPVSYMVMENLLGDYAYRIELSYGTGFICAVFVLAIAWLTISYHSVKAAKANPVKSLRSE